MYKRFVSVDKIHLVLNALDKHYPVIDWSFTVIKDPSGKSRLSLCWRLVRSSKTVVFALQSRLLFHVPAWACYAVIYRYEKVKDLLKSGRLVRGS